MFLFITADSIGIPTGGGKVSMEEAYALSTMENSQSWDRTNLENHGPEPWGWDEKARLQLFSSNLKPRLVHIYSGTWPTTIRYLKSIGTKTSITCAAHDKDISKREHEKLGLPFPYTHLTDPTLWERYSSCYKECDVLICPSTRAAEICKRYGCRNRIEVIPHGVDIPEESKLKPPPKRFTVGYLGSYGADKGVMYLLEAWKKLAYKDASLVLGGRESTSEWVRHLITRYGRGSIEIRGWVDNVTDFYNSINCYLQSSSTEGFGLEVLEAMAHSRFALCSDGAGAADVVPAVYRIPACSSMELAGAIDQIKSYGWVHWKEFGERAREDSKQYSWDKIRERYREVWRSLL